MPVCGQPRADRSEHRRQLRGAFEPAQVAGREDQPALVAHVLARGALSRRSDADLREAPGHDEAFGEGFVDPGAVAAGFAEVVLPGVAVRVDVHHGQRAPQPPAVGAQQRQRDAVVAAEPDHVVAPDQRVGQRHQRSAHRVERRVGQRQVARVAEPTERADVEVRMDRVAQHVAGQTDRARAETRAGAVGGRTVPRDAGDGKGLVERGAGLQETGAVEECKAGHRSGRRQSSPHDKHAAASRAGRRGRACSMSACDGGAVDPSRVSTRGRFCVFAPRNLE